MTDANNSIQFCICICMLSTYFHSISQIIPLPQSTGAGDRAPAHEAVKKAFLRTEKNLPTLQKKEANNLAASDNPQPPHIAWCQVTNTTQWDGDDPWICDSDPQMSVSPPTNPGMVATAKKHSWSAKKPSLHPWNLAMIPEKPHDYKLFTPSINKLHHLFSSMKSTILPTINKPSISPSIPPPVPWR